MQVGPALGNPAGAQVLPAPCGEVRQIQHAGQPGRIEPGRTHRPTELVHVHGELQLLDAPPELVEQHPQHAVTDVAHVTRQQFVGQVHTGRHGLQLLPHEVDVGVAGVGRVGEGHLLPVHQLLHRPRLQPHHRDAIGVLLHGQASDGVQLRRPITTGTSDEAGEEVADLLPEQHRVVIVVQGLQAE
ncbi:hypothetical protein D9M69_544690 [compost metagenome]